ncbi:E3 ubiquitin-protein ligase XIAP-like isoform X2 [Argopecten irradians]|uniref:E3 ubiquitin-protein ligase XIAP-like isoform X2 n=1 Tax=Argopecten irradians TaxID=31199 RepID=UPI003719380A
MSSFGGPYRGCRDTSRCRRHSEHIFGKYFHPRHRRSQSDGGVTSSRQQEKRPNFAHNNVIRNKSELSKCLFKSFNKPVKSGERDKSTEASVQYDKLVNLEVFKRRLNYQHETLGVWSRKPSVVIDRIIIFIAVFAIISCIVYDIRILYIIMHVLVIIGLIKDIQSIDVESKMDKLCFSKCSVTIQDVKSVKDKTETFSSLVFKKNFSSLCLPLHHKTYLDVFPSSLNLYFQSSADGDTSQSMNIEWLRLQSFSAHRDMNVRPILLARAGFYHTGTLDKVRCYSCGKYRSNWIAGEDPFEIHRQISPMCRHVNDSDDSNIPIPRDTDDDHSSQNPTTASQPLPTNYGEPVLHNKHQTASDGNLQSGTSIGVSGVNNGEDGRNGRHFNTPIRNIDTQQEDPSGEYRTNEREPIPTYPTDRPTQTQHMARSYLNGQSPERAHDNVRNGQHNTGPQMNDTASGLRNTSPVQNRRSHTGSSSASGSVSESVIQKLAPLGVIFDKPKYPAFAVLTVRISSFRGWSGSQAPRLMAEAGLVYAGYADYTRCFFCGGGLRNWEDGDDPWIEHARWFPKCGYLRQNKGLDFIRLVHERVTTDDQVNEKCNGKTSGKVCENPDELLTDKMMEELPAFQSVLQQGYSPEQAKQVIQDLWSKGKSDIHSTDILREMLRTNEGGCTTMDDRGLPSSENIPNTNSEDPDEREVRRLMEENHRLKKQMLCRICEDEDASIAFLPCAHLLCCQICAQAVRRCPVCGVIIQGTVKTWLT